MIAAEPVGREEIQIEVSFILIAFGTKSMTNASFLWFRHAALCECAPKSTL